MSLAPAPGVVNAGKMAATGARSRRLSALGLYNRPYLRIEVFFCLAARIHLRE